MNAEFREVPLILIKRQHIKVSIRGPHLINYGHWWFEIGNASDWDNSESYGWWPSKPVDLKQTFKGVPGCLNFGANRKHDPHHGDSAEVEFHPLVKVTDRRNDEQIADCLRTFAFNYEGDWQWIFEYGQNCHSFQLDALTHCGLREPGTKN